MASSSSSSSSSKKRGLSQVTSSSAAGTAVTSVTIDDPCWGSCSQHSLEHLLNQIDRKKCLLMETDDYIALNKPADLRMDGNYPATVHKLLTFWFPPAEFLEKGTDTGDPDPNSFSKERLLKKISQVHRHNETNNAFRPCHQLDYATSGVLLVARNKHAANVARLAFEERYAKKTYLAVLHGHLDLTSSHFGSIPVVSQDYLHKTMSKLEESYRQTRHRRRKDTFCGFQPAHSLFQQWQMQHRPKKGNQSENKRRNSINLSQDEWNQVWKVLSLEPDEHGKESTSEMLLSMTWKDVKARPHLCSAFQKSADEYNQIMKDKKQKASYVFMPLKEFPTIFRVDGDVSALERFYIFAALADPIDGGFSMRLSPSLLETDCKPFSTSVNTKIHFPPAPLQIGDECLDYKPALTEVRVLQRTYLEDYPVTKVLLEPRTGRRHQLRVHTALVGHSIVGDQTYQPPMAATDLSSRMCLHSYSLKIPLKAEDYERSCVHRFKAIQMTSDDPFPVHAGKVSVRTI